MNNMILWSLWYGVLVTLPPVMTRLLIKRSMSRVRSGRRMLNGEPKRGGVT
jgi:hypothetical protein